MANRRTITSSIWEDDWFGPLSYFEQALWIGLFSKCADDQGRLLDNPVLIRASVFPYKDVNLEDIETGLCIFAGAERTYRYTDANGKKLIQVLNWWSHQAPQWASASQWTPPPGWQDHIRTRENDQYVVENWLGKAGNAEQHRDWLARMKAQCDVQVNVQLVPIDGVQVTNTDGVHLEGRSARHVPVPVPVPVPAEASPAAFQQAVSIWEDMTGRITDRIREQFAVAADEYGEERLLYAIQEAHDHNAKSWAYVEAVLEGRSKRVRDSPGQPPAEESRGPPKPITYYDPFLGNGKIVTWGVTDAADDAQ